MGIDGTHEPKTVSYYQVDQRTHIDQRTHKEQSAWQTMMW